ncbi:MAG: zinc dependent phospholipase C family protein [Candidatus Magnetoovum sp. WYHC-5]|nr:zinc dependent phospholipase C family protein [Candidatus Magnetoovum sp. WYHC-5]
MLTIIFFVGVFLLIPSSNCYAWGPLTHVFLGNELLIFPYLIPASIYMVIRRHTDDFLYGNLMADTVLGKKYMPEPENSHSWPFGFNLLYNATNEHEKSFCYGYLCHLAADTVAHGLLTKEKKNIEHTLYELKADSFINKKYWIKAVTILKAAQRRNDTFLENSMETYMFSFKTNKRIFKSMVFMSILTSVSFSPEFKRKKSLLSYVPDKDSISKLRSESIYRMVDILRKGTDSAVTQISPMGDSEE